MAAGLESQPLAKHEHAGERNRRSLEIRGVQDESEKSFEELFGVDGAARSHFNVYFFLRKWSTHVIVLSCGPLGTLLLIVTKLETVESLRFLNLIGCTIGAVTAQVTCGIMLCLCWLCQKRLYTWTGLVGFVVIVMFKVFLVSVKYGYFTRDLMQRIRENASSINRYAIYLLAVWYKIPLALMKVELRLAVSRVQTDKGGWVTELPMRFVRTPAWMSDPRFQTFLNTNCCGRVVSWNLNEDTVAFVKEVYASCESSSRTASHIERGTSCTIVVGCLAELLLLATTVPGDPFKKHCSSDPFARATAWLFALIPIAARLLLAMVSGHCPFDVTPWNICLVTSITLVTAYLIQSEAYHFQIYMKTVAIDLRRRLDMESHLIALLGPQVVSDFPSGDSIVRASRQSIFAGAELDLSDASTVDGLNALRRCCRTFGRCWFQRLQIFISALFLTVIAAGITIIILLFVKTPQKWDEVRWAAIPSVVVLALPLMVTLLRSVSLGLQLNLLGEEYWPLLLETVRANNRVAAHQQASSRDQNAADIALASMSKYILSVQTRYPQKVLGIKASKNLIRSIRTFALSLVTAIVKRWFDVVRTVA